jgi:mono/diheme cytochrome c family protein
MSFAGRSWPKIGKKMLTLTPLGKQRVHPNDSVLGPLAQTGGNQQGLTASYTDMIQAAFQPRYWQNDDEIVTVADGTTTVEPHPGGQLSTDQFTQMEANFALFFGLAVQLYEITLVSDDTPFDQFAEGNRSALTASQQRGLTTFLDNCTACHSGSEFTNHSVESIMGGAALGGLPLASVERMLVGTNVVLYDQGFYDSGVRPSGEDQGRGANDPFGRPLSFSRLARLKALGLLPEEMAPFVPDLPLRVFEEEPAVDSTIKTPGLRNVELTGPYFRNGGMVSLREVVDFSARGSDFPDNPEIHPDKREIAILQAGEQQKDDLVAFMIGLTDERVRQERAPFDHPQLFVPNGALDADPSEDIFIEVPAVGAGGRPAEGLPALSTFLDVDPFNADTGDTQPPTGTIVIDSGVPFTTNPNVTLTLTATDDISGVEDMRLGRSLAELAAAEFQPFATVATITLTEPDGVKTVLVQFRDRARNTSIAFSDTIILDRTGPTGSLVINGGAARTNRDTVTLEFTAADPLTGVAQMRFAQSRTALAAAPYQPFASTGALKFTGRQGTKGVFAQYQDVAGNESAVVSDTIDMTRATTLRFFAKPRTVGDGGRVRLSGRLTDLNGAPVRRAKIKFRHRGRVQAQIRTNRGGRFTLNIRPQQTRRLRAVFDGGSTYNQSKSRLIRVRVRR